MQQQQQIEALRQEIREKRLLIDDLELDQKYEELKHMPGPKNWVVFFHEFERKKHDFLLQKYNFFVNLPAATIEFFDAQANLLGKTDLPPNCDWKDLFAYCVEDHLRWTQELSGDVFQPIRVDFQYREKQGPFAFCILKYGPVRDS